MLPSFYSSHIKLPLIFALLLLAHWCRASGEPSKPVEPISSPLKVKQIDFVYWGWSKSILNYQLDIVTQLLEMSRPELGAVKLNVVARDFMAVRGAHDDPAQGRYAVSFTTDVLRGLDIDADIFVSSYGYLNHLLGIRRCIIRESMAGQFQHIQSLEDFAHYRVGQSAGWPDVDVYRHSGVQVVESQNLAYLSAMLEKGRFDCLPLGTIEVDDYVTAGKGLVTDDSLFVVYPLLMRLMSASHSVGEFFDNKLVEAREKGVVDKLLLKHFGASAIPPLAGSRVVFMDNPQFDAKSNAREREKIRLMYGLRNL